MSRKTVVIGAMKPLTAGHYKLITEAVADSKVPAGEVESNETYVLMSIQDRLRQGEMPVHGETSLEALRDIYLPSQSFMRFDTALKRVNLVLCHSTKFAEGDPDRMVRIKKIIDEMYEVLENNGITNINISLQEVRSGPPDYLIDLASQNPDDDFILYTGQDDLKKYSFLPKYAQNIQFAGFERFEGGLSGTETRDLMKKDTLSAEEEQRFSSVFPKGVDSDAVRALYRNRAGLNEHLINDILAESNDLMMTMGTEEYGNRIDELISQLKDVKVSLRPRRKKEFRKEAGMLQNAISSLRYLKRKNQRICDQNEINEGLTRSDIKDFFYRIKK